MRRERPPDSAEGGAQLRGQARLVQTHISPPPPLFDPWLVCAHSSVRRLAQEIEQSWAETLDTGRARSLRKSDRENRHTVLLAVLSNLAFALASGVDSPAVSVSLRGLRQKTSRYERRGFRALPNLIDNLSKPTGGTLLRLQRSHVLGVASTIIATDAFVEEVCNAASPPLAKDFAQASGRENILLSRIERNYAGGAEHREMIDYSDTTVTLGYRSEVEAINEHLRRADLLFAPDDEPPVMTGIRSLRRHFNQTVDIGSRTARFDLGGRLFGGWWLGLPKARRQGIRIEGEPIADLDFAGMFLRLAYLRAGVTPPDGDLYACLEGFSEARWRPGVKQVVSAMLFRSAPLQKLPRGSRALLPPSVSAAEIRGAVLEAHPALRETFETGVGLSLMFTESQILIAALLATIEVGLVALPMHDGLMVPQSKAGEAMAIMQDAAERIVDFRLPVLRKD